MAIVRQKHKPNVWSNNIKKYFALSSGQHIMNLTKSEFATSDFNLKK